ncbi:hypothetical protein BOW53_03610 [Solemya pervernicosa gill symbiont]|uniref:HYR domain-containing protein n=2 Tax=Gammaproteobacteria incertae sedis TaxID=118884 RepID=A0A1T2L8Q5_9GAMM|nr:FG-GAP-like repeat-containing protein [Candidatus Reidiella endopervernicosa]OOZ41471.1 hypothetical protein BOW53_03610 [Solemya pervernicosa gill symbiont]QKQ27334.1 VCBS repeat-containing protein [Candidatus Reidiella endopervernicosa]
MTRTPVHFINAITLLLLLIVSTQLCAATTGLPFTEDFSAATLNDTSLSNAHWSTTEQTVYLAWRERQIGLPDDTETGTVIDSDVNFTTRVTLGDVDGDGDLDLVAGNTSANLLYLNDGSAGFPLSGSAIGSEADTTWQVHLIDIDGDGDLDLLTANYNATNKLYFNDGSGVFSATGVDIGSDTDSTRDIALGDVNGDGKLDLVSGNMGRTHKLYLGDGSGGFSATGVAIGSETEDTLSVRLGDLDGDGDLDLVVGNQRQVNRRYLNDGSGGFPATGTVIGSEDELTYDTLLGDVDSDGDLDFLSLGYEGNRLYLNDGSGGFPSNGAPISSDTYKNTLEGVLIDLDYDGDLDLVVANVGARNKYYLNDGSGVFSESTDIGSESDITYSLSMGDLNGDGALDMVTGRQSATNKLYMSSSSSTGGGFDASGTVIGSEVEKNWDVSLGDVDGDGDLDVIVAVQSATNKLYLNDGSGGFTTGTGTSIGTESDITYAVELGDIDGDGDLDLVTGTAPGINKLYLNNGSGSFSATGTAIGSETDNTRAVALADLDNDGDLDVVAGNAGDTHKYYLNDGSGGFPATGTDIGSDTDTTWEIALADLNGDGFPDLVAGNFQERNKLYLNDGSGGFTTGAGTDVGSDLGETYDVTLSDVDEDGDLDLISGDANQIIKLYLNDGSGGFTTGAGTAIGSETDNTTAVEVADINGDGHIDLVAGAHGNVSKFYLGDGSGGFSATGTQLGSNRDATFAIILGDLDGDGDFDMVNASDGNTHKLYMNNSGDGFSISTAIGSETESSYKAALGDVDGDGDLDLIIGNYNQTNRLYLNDGSGGYPATGSAIGSSDTDSTRAIKLGDVDGDSDLDLVVGNQNQTNKLYLNDGSGGFPSSGRDIGSETNYTSGIELTDIDQDGDLDVVAGNNGQTSKFYLNNGSGLFSATGSDIGSETNPTWSIAVGDLNGDNYPDVVTGVGNQTNRLYLNNGSGGFPATGTAIDTDSDNTTTIALGDVDGDNDLDLVSGSYGGINKLYRNNGSGLFNASGVAIGIDADQHWDLVLGDLDRDGDLDLVTGNPSGSNRLYWNNGSGSFSVSGEAIGSETDDTRGMALGDVDGNGYLDLIAANYNVTNKLYLQTKQYQLSGLAVSKKVNDSETDILTVRLSATETSSADTSIDYYLSNNGGTNWYKVISGEFFTFPDTGTDDLRWKAKLQTLSAARSPALSQIALQPFNTAPMLGGTFTTAGTVNDNATTSPFSGVTIADIESNDVSVAIGYSAANGTLSGTGLSGSAGGYILGSTDLTTLTSRLQALIFTPTTDQVITGNSVITTFTLTPNDGTVNGSANATTKVSATSVNKTPTGGVTISGKPTQFQILRASNDLADVDGLGGIGYQWKRGGSVIEGATSDSYPLQQADVGQTMTVTASYRDLENTDESVTSSATSTVVNVNDAPINTVLPIISGTVEVGNTISSSSGSWSDADGDGRVYSYQWRADGTNIGTDSNSYTLTGIEAHKSISVVVTANDSKGGITSATSVARTVGNVAPTISGNPATKVGDDVDYSFIPTVNDNDGDKLTFSIVNKPAWANFDTSSGALFGTPDSSDIGTTRGVVISVSDGEFESSLSAFKVWVFADMDNDNISDRIDSDIDGDGIENDWESDNGLDPYDPSDAAGDLDGDGLSNLEEFIAETNPAVDDNPPLVTAPDDVMVDATGLLTPVSLGSAIAIDGMDGNLTVTSDAPSHFKPGVHLVTWSATDSAGNSGSAIQMVMVNPMVDFSKDQLTAEGSSVTFNVILNGEAANYPVIVPYSVGGSAATDGSDHSLISATATLEEGTELAVSFATIDDGAGEGVENIVVTMGSPTNAVKGSMTTHTISLVEGNVAPIVTLSANQGFGDTRTVISGGGVVSLISSVSDPNIGDTHSYNWVASDNALVDGDGDSEADTFSFDPSGLSRGIYTVALDVSDGSASDATEITLNIVAAAPRLDQSDSDGDGIDDESEGYGDSDGDGVADYLDAISIPNVLQEQSGEAASYLIETEPGLRLSLGAIAFQTGNGQAEVNMEDVSNGGGDTDDSPEYDYTSELFDFIVSELPVAGQSIKVVIPQFVTIPANAVYRKWMPGGWQAFVEEGSNGLASAVGEAGFCPPPGDSAYQSGLNEGHWCVELTIEDGGPNDADSEANNSVVDPGGVAQQLAINEGSSSGGGALHPLWLLLGLTGLSSLMARRKGRGEWV